METFITIGEIIRHYRKELGLSQEALSDGICHRKYISSIEQNKQIPTLDIINQLSDRLGVNLYETYALMLQHVNIETHKRIEELNKHSSVNEHSKLQALIQEYEVLPEFHHGEPFLALTQAKAMHLAWCKNDYHAVIALISDALVQEGVDIDTHSLSCTLSNKTLTLLNSLAINHCRVGELFEGQRYFEFLIAYVDHYFKSNHYATNRNNQFELKFMVNLTYNYFLFFREKGNIALRKLDEILSLMKSLHNCYLLPELLFCKTYLLLANEESDVAQETYSTAHALGLYLYGEKYLVHLEKTILDKYFSFLQNSK